MPGPLPTGRLALILSLGGALVSLLVPLSIPAAETLPAPAPAKPAAAPASAEVVVDLAACRRLALEKQPALGAYRASLAAAHTKVAALHNLGRIASLVRHDLCVRQRQAALGVVAAEARLHQAEVETLYAVTRLYWTAVFALGQLELAEDTLSQKKDQPDSLHYRKAELEKFRKKRQNDDVWLKSQFDTLIATAEGKREEARQGVQRALAALREAIGLPPGCSLTLKDKELPAPTGELTREQALALALARRGEIGQAGIAAEVVELEVCAQELVGGVKAETFASGSDLHAQALPTGSFGEDYRPAAVGIEMPATLVGPRCLRVEQAQHLHQRALAVLAKTRGLVTLETEDAYLRWQEIQARVVAQQKAYATAGKALADLYLALEDETLDASKATISDALNYLLVRVVLRAQKDRARLDLVLALAALERITAGGFCPAFDRSANEGKTGSAKPDNGKDLAGDRAAARRGNGDDMASMKQGKTGNLADMKNGDGQDLAGTKPE